MVSPRSLADAVRLHFEGPRLRLQRTEKGERALLFETARAPRTAAPDLEGPAPRRAFMDDPGEVGFRRGLLRSAREGHDLFVIDEETRAPALERFAPIERVRVPTPDGAVERPALRLTPDVRRRVIGEGPAPLLARARGAAASAALRFAPLREAAPATEAPAQLRPDGARQGRRTTPPSADDLQDLTRRAARFDGREDASQRAEEALDDLMEAFARTSNPRQALSRAIEDTADERAVRVLRRVEADMPLAQTQIRMSAALERQRRGRGPMYAADDTARKRYWGEIANNLQDEYAPENVASALEAFGEVWDGFFKEFDALRRARNLAPGLSEPIERIGETLKAFDGFLNEAHIEEGLTLLRAFRAQHEEALAKATTTYDDGSTSTALEVFDAAIENYELSTRSQNAIRAALTNGEPEAEGYALIESLRDALEGSPIEAAFDDLLMDLPPDAVGDPIDAFEQAGPILAKLRRNLDEFWDEWQATMGGEADKLQSARGKDINEADWPIARVDVALRDLITSFDNAEDGPSLRAYSRPRGVRFAFGDEAAGLDAAATKAALAEAVGAEALDTLMRAGKLDIVDRMPDLGRGAPSWVGALYDPQSDRTYVRAGAFRPERLRSILLHEIGEHAGLETMMGARAYRDLLGAVDDMVRREDPAAVAAHNLATAYAADPDDIARETLAYMIEAADDAAEGPSRSLVQRVLDAVRAWFVRTFPKMVRDLDERDLRTLAKASLRAYVRRAGRELEGQAWLKPEAAHMIARAFGFDGAPEEAGRWLAASFASPGPFVSQLWRAVDGAKTQEAPAAQWKATLKNAAGVKQEELDWTGVVEWLDAQTGPVSRRDLQAYLRDNGVKVEETVLGGDGADPELQARMLPLIEERERLERSLDAYVQMGAANLTDAQRAEVSATRARIIEISGDIAVLRQQVDAQRSRNGARWSQYTLPGGENYRELLMRLPERDTITRERTTNPQGWGGGPDGTEGYVERGNTGADYRSSHFDQPNILAHVRFNERTDANGKRTLFIEEVQSDWHQAGRERGYRDDTRRQEIDAEARAIVEAGGTVTPEARARWDELQAEADEIAKAQARAVPDAPFKDNKWAALAIKRMIRWAADNGFDQIAWTPGRVQVERFSLEHVADKLRLRDDAVRPGTYELFVFKDEVMAMAPRHVQDIDELRSLVGRNVADKLLAERPDEQGFRNVSGEDLRVGGEGMRAFYDRILPNIANDIGKKYGARVGEIEVDASMRREPYVSGDVWRIGNPQRGAGPIAGTPTFRSKKDAQAWIDANPERRTVPALPITPELRDAALRGLPVFAKGGDLYPPSVLMWSDKERLRELADLARRADPETIFAHPVMQTIYARAEEGLTLRATMRREDKRKPEAWRGRTYRVNGADVDLRGAVAALRQRYEGAAGGRVRKDRQAVVVLGYPGAGKSTVSRPIARALKAAWVDADLAKDLIPAYRDGYGTAEVLNESAGLRDIVETMLLRDGANIVIEKIGENAEDLARVAQRLRDHEYDVRFAFADVAFDEAVRRSVRRFLRTGRYIEPQAYDRYRDLPPAAFDAAIAQAIADGYIHIDVNGQKPAIRGAENADDLARSFGSLPRSGGAGLRGGRPSGGRSGSQGASGRARVNERDYRRQGVTQRDKNTAVGASAALAPAVVGAGVAAIAAQSEKGREERQAAFAAGEADAVARKGRAAAQTKRNSRREQINAAVRTRDPGLIPPMKLPPPVKDAHGNPKQEVPPAQRDELIDLASRISGADGVYLANVIARESQWDALNTPWDPRRGANLSSAQGLGQFLDSTWDAMRRHFPSAAAMDAAVWRDLRTDPRWAATAAGVFAVENARSLMARLNRPVTHAEVYAAHFAGADGAIALIEGAARGDRNAARLLPAAAAANKGVFYERSGRVRTAQEVMADFARDLGDAPFTIREQRTPRRGGRAASSERPNPADSL